MKKKIFSLCMMLAPHLCSAYTPWFTGPLLAPQGKALPQGHANFEFYGSAIDANGVFNDSRQLTHIPTGRAQNTTPLMTLGLTDHINIELIQPYNWNEYRNKKQQGIGDFQSVLGYWLFQQDESFWFPDVYITYNQIIPLGRYQNINPRYANVGVLGSGSYQSGVVLNFQHLQPVLKDFYLRTRLSLQYMHPFSTSVHGFNAYGGGFGTNGRIKPGDFQTATMAAELSLNQNWVAVMEAQTLHRQSSSFTGEKGYTITGQPAKIGHEAIDYISLAPAVEYNFNQHYGIIAGLWFSIKGKNQDNFRNLMVAFNAYY